LKTTLDKWDSDFSKNEIDDMSWRIDGMRTALHRVEPI
jgi:hypothetical protein